MGYIAEMAYLSQSLTDPTGSDTLVTAVQWLQGTLLGTVATTVAVISVATMGFMMLAGRIDWRRGTSVVIGCFILFGASSIVAGIQSFIGRDEQTDPAQTYIAAPSAHVLPAVQSTPYDPYAGAAVPSGG